MSLQYPDTLEFTVPPWGAMKTLRVFLGDIMPLDPEDFIREVTKAHKVRIAGEVVNGKRVLTTGEVITLSGLAAEYSGYHAPSLRLDVLYEDDSIILFDKPAGCTVVRERWCDVCPFQNGVLDYLRRSPSGEAVVRAAYRPRAVHRLDRDTTGVVVVAKAREGEIHLFKQFLNRTIQKEYLTVVVGEVAPDSGVIEAPISPHEKDLERMIIDERHGKPSTTRYEVVERFRGYTLVRALPHTGRRHQIRLHMGHIGHPVLADALYQGGSGLLLSTIKRRYHLRGKSEEKPLITRCALHAAAITFLPVGKTEPVRVESPLPKDMSVVLKMLRKYAGSASPR